MLLIPTIWGVLFVTALLFAAVDIAEGRPRGHLTLIVASAVSLVFMLDFVTDEREPARWTAVFIVPLQAAAIALAWASRPHRGRDVGA